MTTDYDINDLAAEYVLGTLDAQERVEVESRRATEPMLAATIVAIERDLEPLATLASDVAPPPAIRARLLETVARLPQVAVGTAARADTRLSTAPPPPVDDAAVSRPDFTKLRPGNLLGRDADEDPAIALSSARGEIVELRGRVNRWRGLTAAVTTVAASLAASLAGLLIYRDALRPLPIPAQQTFVAVLQKNDQSPAFLMTVDVGKRIFTVRPVAAKQPSGKNYELWIIHEKLGAPKSLGIIADNSARAGVSLAAYDAAAISGATYAVTVEPTGGSPTGAPTSAPVFIGTLLPAGLAVP